ncbi:hypothetical protein TL16_g07831 [Triparma laevis f. inornata]|uniref:Elongation factor 1-gamma n=2 Tax=Triparma laevis TaxID=1534972 RepID=A0A9W7E2C1_9STRA|nr:hypothetical protein TrLO_g15158 [Triparma laevis f. longispina]GMH78516.1 hypothetical protein TL16_g07831 [Triparma laevis f. inornata]
MSTLYTFPGNFRAFKALIAAEYNGMDISVEDWSEEAAALSPLGKAPVLSTPSGVVFESNAIARYIARARADTELLGASFVEQAQVDSWIDFCANEIELPASMWTYPVLGYMPFNLVAYTKAKEDLAKGLKTLDTYLLTRTYLVGEKITLADICITSALVYVMKFVADKTYLKPFGNVVRYFTTCANQPEFKAVIGETPLAKEEMLAPGAPTPKKAEPAKKAAKKEKKPAADAPPPAVKKVEHPYKIMDKEKPSKFSMDAWKKAYSNAATYEAGMQYFWENADLEGWSVWHQIYNYNEENKRIFMASNAIGGFQQRSDEVRKWAFGVMDLVGTEETVLEIKGIWLLRGDTVDHLKEANDDANWYTWKKLCGPGLAPTEEVKKQVFDYWCQENELEGKPIQDSKVFK